MAVSDASRDGASTLSSLFYDPKIRGIVTQVILAILMVVLVYWILGNTVENLERANIASGFGFLNGRAGFDLAQTPIAFTSDSTYLRALYVGILNTIIVAAVGIVTALVLGFIVGIARLSGNWLIRTLATVYVEIFRNIPPLLQIFFWYFGVLSVLPQPKDSITVPGGIFLNSRGVFFPKIIFGEGSGLILIGLATALVISVLVWWMARKRQTETGQQFPVFWT